MYGTRRRPGSETFGRQVERARATLMEAAEVCDFVASLREFTRSVECEKCGATSRAPQLRHCTGPQYNDLMPEPRKDCARLNGYEHMHVTCKRCGFVWIETLPGVKETLLELVTASETSTRDWLAAALRCMRRHGAGTEIPDTREPEAPEEELGSLW